MAASKKRRFTRKPRVKADWVFRNDLYDVGGNAIDASGSYVPNVSKVLVPGFASGTVFWLYDSYNLDMQSEFAGGGAQPIAKGKWRRSEAANPKILRVSGEMSFTPSVWALGSSYFLGVRFGIFTQDAYTGLALFDQRYNLWGTTNVTEDQQQPARFANDRSWQHQRMTIVRFNDNNATLNWLFNFRVNRRLRPDEGYGVYVETAVGSVNLTVNNRLRTLVADDNA